MQEDAPSELAIPSAESILNPGRARTESFDHRPAMENTIPVIFNPSLLMAVLLLIPQGVPGNVSFDYQKQLGVVFIVGENTGCLSLHNPDLKPGTRFSVLSVADSGMSWGSEVMVGVTREALGRDCNPASAERDDSSHQVKIVKGRVVEGMAYLVILVPPEKFTVSEKPVQVDLDGDGVQESFRLCTSNEGLHFTVWSGKPLEGTRRWHRYHYLGFDVEPNCVEADYKKPGT